MIAKPKSAVSAVALATADLYEMVQNLIRSTSNSRKFYPWADQANRLIESLPVTTSVFDLARRRLANAKRYVDSDEAGAAKFELRMLAGSIRPALKDFGIPIDSESLSDTAPLPGPPTAQYGELKKKNPQQTQIQHA